MYSVKIELALAHVGQNKTTYDEKDLSVVCPIAKELKSNHLTNIARSWFTQ
jgi:hypothetical protein